jgi:peptidoglycan/LPS O-acetylase OafA/YrhL
MVFFVLSGLFVGGSVLKSGTSFNLVDYSIARLTRLWIVLIPALVVTFGVDTIIAAHAPEVLRGGLYSVWSSGPRDDYSASALTFLGTILFLHTILTPVFGTNNPLWSLANEFWYYATFPLLAIAAGQCGVSKKPLIRAAGGIAAILLLLCLPDGIRCGFLAWLMGVVVHLASNRIPCKRRSLALFSALIVFSASLIYSKESALQAALHLPSDLAVVLGFAVFSVVIATSPPPRNTPLGVATTKLAGASSEFSYSLYACHFPFVVLIAVLGYSSAKVLPDKAGLVQFFGWFGVLLTLGILFWFLFERHTGLIRRLVSSRVTRRSS